MPNYLSQWFINENGGSPVHLKKGSVESIILQQFLIKQPSDYIPSPKQPDEVEVVIPEFRFKDPATYNYLPKDARDFFVDTVRERFVLQLFTDLHKFGNLGRNRQRLIEMWMKQHGIEYSGTTWDSIAKIYQRCVERYRKNNYRKRKKA